MRSALALVLVSLLLLTLSAASPARETRLREYRIRQDWSPDEFAAEDIPGTDYLGPQLFTSSAVDTYTLVYYDFEQMNWQGWTRVDLTAPIDTFWHVEDYAEPELAGLPGPLEGLKSAWCGAPPGPYRYLCAWVAAPGYGNSWEESLVTDAFRFTGSLRFSYHGYFDSEPDYDWTLVEYDRGGGNWIEIARYDDSGDTVAAHELHLSGKATKLRFHFVSDRARSDEDGLWNTDGAAHIDEITIEDKTGILDYEDFEGAADGAHGSGLWHAETRYAFGSYARLWNNLVDEDPCGSNAGTQIAFFDVPFEPPGPGLAWTPFCKGAGMIEAPCQSELVVSPVIDIRRCSTGRDENQDAEIPPGELPNLGGALLRFTVYRDLPYANLVGYQWMVRTIENGCPGPWQDRGFINMGGYKDYLYSFNEIGDLVRGDSIQVGFWVADLCDLWYLVYGNCAEHTPSPFFDNIFVQRYTQVGPHWRWRDLDLFQDNFPQNQFDLESYVRADAANDLRPNDDPVIDPGDSIVVTCQSPLGGGIDTLPDGSPRVYMHVHCGYVGDPASPKPDLYGPNLEGTYGRYVSDDGQWTILQCDRARIEAGAIASDRYMVDLNDSLFTRGYEIVYYFKAYDFDGHSSTLPARAEEFPWPPADRPWPRILHWQSGPYFFEWTCLPTLASDFLYVDDFHGRGTTDGVAQHYWDFAFSHIIPSDNQPDRYDVNSPSSCVSNGPGSRAKNFQMTTAYTAVIWDSGNLSTCTISEGTDYSDKSNDARMLIDWMEFSEHNVSLWVCGDDVAADLAGAPSSVALELLASYCGVDLVNDSYFELTGGGEGAGRGGIVNPLVKAVVDPNNPFWHGDSFYVFGGCPRVNRFDALGAVGGGEYALRYPDFSGQPYYAAVYKQGINSGGFSIRTMWFGFSFMYMREPDCMVPMMRSLVCDDIYRWFWHSSNVYITDADPVPRVNSLAQNFPNPFNPSTMISFSVREKGHVTLRIYDVAGRLVRTLIDEVRDAGGYREGWDGRNNRGASGVYFYRMRTAGFERTKKMVLLR